MKKYKELWFYRWMFYGTRTDLHHRRKDMNAILPGSTSSKTRQALSIDMTPMVDLGFLLITFFIFTTSMNEEKSLKLFMPDPRGSSEIKESHAATILLGKNHTAYYYEGFFEAAIQNNSVTKSRFDKNGIRKLLMEKKNKIGQDIVVLVKPTQDCSYADLVDAMDEMMITGVDKWMMVDAGKAEYDFIEDL